MPVLALKDAFTARAIGLNWDNYKASLGEAPYLGVNKFGVTKQEGLELKFIKGKNGMPVSLKASNFDAKAELRDSIGFSDVQNEMPFFRESIMVTEKEEQDYASYVNSENYAYANQILANIMKKPLDLVRGADVVPERMVWQLLAPIDGIPRITVTIKGETYDIDYTNDEGVAHKQDHFSELTGTDKWSDSANATPLQDLIDLKKNFSKKTGYKLTRFSMNSETWDMVTAAEDTKKQVLGIIAYQGGVRLEDEDVAKYLRGKGITIEVYDKMFIDEAGTTRYFIPTGIVSAQADVYLGAVTYGTTPEERSGDKATGNLSIVNTGVAIYTYTTNHPINTHSVVSEIVLPSFEGMDAVAVMKVA